MDPCCGNSNRCCNSDNPCCESVDPCCDSDDPCCGDSNRCCNFDNPCCGDHNPCCNSDDPCCGNPDRCCNTDNPCCGSDNPCCNVLDPCCGNPDECCNPDNPDCDDPCNGVDCDDSNPCTDDSCLDGVCFHVETCPPTLLGREALACCVGGECCGALCCPMACEECLDNGSLMGGIIDVQPQVPCLGDTLTFTVSGVVDEGGIKRVDCYAKTAIPSAAPTYTWEITRSDGSMVNGSGAVATVLVEMLGNYSCQFTATANRECPPGPRTVGPIATAPPNDYRTVAIVYKTFIAPNAIASPTGFKFFEGDNRWFSTGGNSRTFQGASVTVNPAIASGLAGSPSNAFGPTFGYQNDPAGSDVIACTHCAGPYGDWCIAPGASRECVDLAQIGQNGNVLQVSSTRINDSEIRVNVNAVGYNPCLTGALVPAIDANLTIHFKQECLSGVLEPMEFRLYGTHDGFPWHELYLDGNGVYQHDPCCTGEGPLSLPGEGEHDYEAADACHLTSPPLDQWRQVPGGQ